MSGEGLLPDRPSVPVWERQGECCAASVASGLADFIAYLEQRRDNAGTIAGKVPEFAELARDRARQLEVMIDELRHGLHEGSAAVRAGLTEGKL